MELFAKATKERLRFKIGKGTISTEDLWFIGMIELDKLAVALHKELESQETGSFLNPKKTDAKTQLEFDVVKYVLDARLENAQRAEKAAVTRAKNERIDKIIQRKRDEELENMSVEELEKLKAE